MDQNQNPYQTQYPQGQPGYGQAPQQVNQPNGSYQGAPQNGYPQPVQGQGQWQSAPGYQQPAQQPYQNAPQQPYQSAPQQPYQSVPQQPYVQAMPQQAYAGQYGYAPKKKVNPAVIILPIVGVVLIVGIILLIVFLGGGSSVGTVSSYNSRNPFTISLSDEDDEEYITVRTVGKKEISDVILDYFEDQMQQLMDYYDDLGLDYNFNININRSVDFIVGQPLSIEYDSDDIKGNVRLTFEFPRSLLNDDGYTGEFDGISRYQIIVVTQRSNGEWKINDDDYFSSSSGDEISFSWGSSEKDYLVVVDQDAMAYALGYEP